jgi:hypothetical protein
MFFVRLLSERRFCCCESRMFCWAERATHLQKYRKLSLPPLLLAFSWVLDLKFASEWYPQHHLGCIVKLSCDRHQDHQYEWQQIFWKWQINKKSHRWYGAPRALTIVSGCWETIAAIGSEEHLIPSLAFWNLLFFCCPAANVASLLSVICPRDDGCSFSFEIPHGNDDLLSIFSTKWWGLQGSVLPTVNLSFSSAHLHKKNVSFLTPDEQKEKISILHVCLSFAVQQSLTA